MIDCKCFTVASLLCAKFHVVLMYSYGVILSVCIVMKKKIRFVFLFVLYPLLSMAWGIFCFFFGFWFQTMSTCCNRYWFVITAWSVVVLCFVLNLLPNNECQSKGLIPHSKWHIIWSFFFPFCVFVLYVSSLMHIPVNCHPVEKYSYLDKYFWNVY